MEHIYVNEIQDRQGKTIEGFYMVEEKEIREGKNGLFMRLRLADRSGERGAVRHPQPRKLWIRLVESASHFHHI